MAGWPQVPTADPLTPKSGHTVWEKVCSQTGWWHGAWRTLGISLLPFKAQQFSTRLCQLYVLSPHLVCAVDYCSVLGRVLGSHREWKNRHLPSMGGAPRLSLPIRLLVWLQRLQGAGLLKANWRGIHPAPWQFNQIQLSATETDWVRSWKASRLHPKTWVVLLRWLQATGSRARQTY